VTPEDLLDLFVLAPVGLVAIDEDGRVEIANLSARRLLTPFTRAGSLDDLFESLSAVAPDLAARVRGYDAPRGVVLEGLDLLAPGEQHGVQLALVKVAPGKLVAVATDAGNLAEAVGMVSRLEQRMRAVEGAVRDYAIFTVTLDGLVDSWNESAERVHQWPARDIVGKSLAGLFPSEFGGTAHVRDTLDLAARNGWCEEEGTRMRLDGTTFWANTVVTALRGADAAVLGFSVVTRDLSDRRKLDEVTREDAASTTDYLTGVSTRRAFFEVAGSEVARGRRYGQPLSLLLVDPDRMRELVEQHGHAFSDEWLRAMAWVCRQESRTTDLVGRVGGEEFAVLLPSTELSGGLVLAERIRERMQRHLFQGEFQGVRCTLSVGVSELSDDVTSVDGLLTASATAVQRAKQAGMNLVVGYDA